MLTTGSRAKESQLISTRVQEKEKDLEKEKEKQVIYLQFAQQLAKQNEGQWPTIGYNIHWIYSRPPVLDQPLNG